MLRAPLSTTGELGRDYGASTTRRKVPQRYLEPPQAHRELQAKQNKTKQSMEGCDSPGIKAPIKKAIDDLTPVDMKEKVFFMSACGMLGWLAMTARPDLKYCHSRISQHMYMAEPTAGALEAVRHAVVLRDLGQAVLVPTVQGPEGTAHFSDSGPYGERGATKQALVQLASVLFYGDVLADWSSTATSVQISEAIDNYEAQVAEGSTG